MEKWVGRVALVTGASSGIGAAICKALVQEGMKVFGVARRIDKINELEKELHSQNHKGIFYPLKCDLTIDEEIYTVFETIKKRVGKIDICINNAGLTHNNSLLDGSPSEWREMSDVNVVALCLCTKLAVALMREKGVDDGHIINISSISGHRVVPKGKVHFYAGTKFAVRAITEGLRQEMREANSHIRVSSISPGVVETEFGLEDKNDPEAVKKKYSTVAHLHPSDVASTVLHVISSPANVEINDVIMRPTLQVL